MDGESGGGEGACCGLGYANDFCIFVSSSFNLVLPISVVVLCSLHSGISKILHKIFRGELSTRQPSGNVAANKKVE